MSTAIIKGGRGLFGSIYCFILGLFFKHNSCNYEHSIHKTHEEHVKHTRASRFGGKKATKKNRK